MISTAGADVVKTITSNNIILIYTEVKNDRPFSYSRYWTGSSLQLRLMRRYEYESTMVYYMCCPEIGRVLTNTSTPISQTIASLVDTKFYFSEIVCGNNKQV